MKKYFYILLLEVSFGVKVIEPESQIQNLIYYNPKYENSYFRIGDTNTSFSKDSLEPGQSHLIFSRIHEWPSDYIVEILHLQKNVVRNEIENNKIIENYLSRQFK